jgi:hypothetical protein
MVQWRVFIANKLLKDDFSQIKSIKFINPLLSRSIAVCIYRGQACPSHGYLYDNGTFSLNRQQKTVKDASLQDRDFASKNKYRYFKLSQYGWVSLGFPLPVGSVSLRAKLASCQRL